MKVAAARVAAPRTLRKSYTSESTVPLVSLAAIYGDSVESQRTDPAEGSNRVLTLRVSIPTEIRFRKIAQRS